MSRLSLEVLLRPAENNAKETGCGNTGESSNIGMPIWVLGLDVL